MRRDPTQLSQTKQQAPLKIRLPAVEVHVIVKKTSSNLNQHGEGAEAKTIGWQWAQYLNRRNQYSTCIYKLILPPPVASGNVKDLETLWTGPWDMGFEK